MTFAFDCKLALEQFKKRKAENKDKKRIDNSSLPAGSPMYYYCKCCDDPTDILPEGFVGRPKTICEPCKVLRDHGLIKSNGEIV